MENINITFGYFLKIFNGHGENLGFEREKAFYDIWMTVWWWVEEVPLWVTIMICEEGTVIKFIIVGHNVDKM